MELQVVRATRTDFNGAKARNLKPVLDSQHVVVKHCRNMHKHVLIIEKNTFENY